MAIGYAIRKIPTTRRHRNAKINAPKVSNLGITMKMMMYMIPKHSPMSRAYKIPLTPFILYYLSAMTGLCQNLSSRELSVGRQKPPSSFII
jgi:hypothetical protein